MLHTLYYRAKKRFLTNFIRREQLPELIFAENNGRNDTSRIFYKYVFPRVQYRHFPPRRFARLTFDVLGDDVDQIAGGGYCVSVPPVNAAGNVTRKGLQCRVSSVAIVVVLPGYDGEAVAGAFVRQ